MRNLRLLDTHVVSGLDDVSKGLYLAVDVDVGTVYVATETQLIAVSPTLQQVLACVSLETDEATGAECCPVGLQYLADQQAVCVATRDGRMCLWQMDCPELECVGEVEQGLTSMSWSPDLELVIITTGNDTIIMMTREFDPLTEVPMFTSQSEESPVSVGWGKKETQFHGSAGKQAAKTQTVQVSPVGPYDTRQPAVRWRGDGQFFALSAVDPESDGRFLYVWSRECVFQSRSEPVDGLQHSVSWKPSGSLIASVQSVKHRKQQDVVFFEKNGLRHGEFTIPGSNIDNMLVKSVLWNQDSTVLALWIDHLDGDGKLQSSTIQLWTVGNYHWYLKQCLEFAQGVGTVDWDPEVSHRLCVLTRTGDYLAYTWAWHTCSTPGQVEQDQASVAVIDGAQILMTPMRRMVVPPPMAAYTLTHPSPVNAVAFLTTSGSNDLAALMSNCTVALWTYKDEDVKIDSVKLDAAGGDGFTQRCAVPTQREIVKLEGFDSRTISSNPLGVCNFLWLTPTEFIFSTLASPGAAHSLIHIGELTPEKSVIIVRHSLPVESHITGLAANRATGTVALQSAKGELYKLNSDTPSLSPWQNSSGSEVSFPYPCSQMAVTQIAGEEVVLGLTERFRFYVNDIEVASNCTSFGVHNDFILLTTLSHTVRCICKTTKLEDLPKLSDGKAHPFDESIRRVERGSRIVTVIGDDTKLVLQMPRGNLEAVHPRALVLSTLKRLLDSNKVLEAFLLMRKHRINMNLLHDHNPSHFMENVEQIVSQIQSVNYFNLFLTDLIEDDVTHTMYTASYGRDSVSSAGPNQSQSGSKVDRICDAFIKVFKKLGENKYFLSILTAHVRKTNPELEEALLQVWSLKGKQQSSDDSVTAEDALKYLLFLVDVNMLYDVALGTYNFDLVMMVAEKSQKDPKEYIPFLNHLRRLEETYRHYTIDKYLKRYSKALESIAKCGEEHFEECLNMVSEHKLYRKALQLYKPGTSQYKELASLYGTYLRSKNRHDEAGVMFIKAQDWEQALEAFRASYDWRQVFCMASRLGYEANKLTELAGKVAGELKGRQRFAESARVYEEYAQDPEEAVASLIEGCLWDEAVRVMYKHKRLDLIETHLKEALEESYEHHIEMLTSQREQFNKFRSRLSVVRIEKEKAKTLLDGAAEYNDADADLFSDTTSLTGGSVASLKTYNSARSTVFTKATGSSRNRQKAENKKWSLKEGSAHEEFALVDALGKIIKSTDGMKEEISSLMKTLIQFNYDAKANALQEMFSDLLSLIQASMSEIWIYSQNKSGSVSMGPGTTASAIAQAVQSGQRPQTEEEKLDPVLLVPPTLNKATRWKLHMAGELDR